MDNQEYELLSMIKKGIYTELPNWQPTSEDHAMNFTKYLCRTKYPKETSHQILFLKATDGDKYPRVINAGEIHILDKESSKSTYRNILAQKFRETYEQNGKIFGKLLYLGNDEFEKYYHGGTMKSVDFLLFVANALFRDGIEELLQRGTIKQLTVNPIAIVYHDHQINQGQLQIPHFHLMYNAFFH